MKSILLAYPELQLLFENLNYLEYLILKRIIKKKKFRKVPYLNTKINKVYPSIIYDEAIQ